MFAYLGSQISLNDSNKLLPQSAEVKNELENHNTLFMTLGMYGLP